MTLFRYVRNIGITSDMALHSKKGTRILNVISFSAFLLSLVIVVYSLLLPLPWHSRVIALFICICMFTPLVLNKKGYYLPAKIFFLLIGPSLLVLLTLYYGPGSFFQYFLVPFIGMPILFIKNEIGWKKWIFVFAPVPLWILLELYSKYNLPLLTLPPDTLEVIRISNSLILFIISGVMIYTLADENEDQLRIIDKQNRSLELSNSDLEQFAYIISHDLKTPIRTVISFSEIINKEYSPDFDERLQKMFGFIEAQGRDMNLLINGILEYSRSGRVDNTINSFNLKDEVEKVLNTLNHEGLISITTNNLDHDITGHLIHLQQVIRNLLNNAVTYSDKDTPEITITTSIEKQGMLRISIKDNGPGIPPEFHKTIFVAFKTASRGSRGDATGLGLAIVKKLIAINGGEVGVISDGQEGTEFWFTWPLKAEPIV